jgi:hypothetical protein
VHAIRCDDRAHGRQLEIIFLKTTVHDEKQGGVSREFAKEVLSRGLSPALDKLQNSNASATRPWPELVELKARIKLYTRQAPMVEPPAD